MAVVTKGVLNTVFAFVVSCFAWSVRAVRNPERSAVFATALVAGTLIVPHLVEAQTVAPAYEVRATALLEILKGAEEEESFFAPSFLEAVPPAQFRALSKQLIAQYGEPQSISRIIPASASDGTVEIDYAKATVAMRMVIDKPPQHRVIGLLVTGVSVRDDGLGAVTDEFNALAGNAGFAVAEISANALTVAEHEADRQFAIGSVFKLYVLAALAHETAAGRRNWSDAVPLSHKSLPSGILQNWPNDSPLTLHSLATLMISMSDNTATDILIHHLGRDAVDRVVSQSGHSAADRMVPTLTTLEAFALKMPDNIDLRERFSALDDQGQKKLLDDAADRLTLDKVSIANFAGDPVHIETIEWFASPQDINRLLARLNQSSDPKVKQILAINPLVGPGDAKRWDYIGGKGGSEPGVISYAWLAQSKSGKSYAVSGSWNNPKEPVDKAKFLSLMNRLLNIVAKR